jgi:signal peptidase I
LGPATRDTRRRHKEPLLAQIASFVDLFVWLLVLKTFFLPLFIIPTGSMAETLAGAHATHTCPNCGWEYAIGPYRAIDHMGRRREGLAPIIQCPNCRWQEQTRAASPTGLPLRLQAGDRIVVHGWLCDIGGPFAPRRWDVVVFKNPSEPHVNYIKRLIGLPGETIEIIDGDIWVKDGNEERLHVARKTPHAQRSLWFPYYNHDYPPAKPSVDALGRSNYRHGRWHGSYRPRWVATEEQTAWVGLDTRTPHFDGRAQPRQQIQFTTRAGRDALPGEILDTYGYNAYRPDYHHVTDVRLSTDVLIHDGDGYIELNLSKYDDVFYARLGADGRLTLEHESSPSQQRETWGETYVPLPDRPVRLALGHADYRVAVELDGQTVLESRPQQHRVTPAVARQRAARRVSPFIRIAAERVQASLAHLLIERDVHYTSRGRGPNSRTRAGTGTLGHPVPLKDDAYFVLGDNSPDSQDSRWWEVADIGPHLQAAHAEGRYDVGTVPADQMIGRAFFVYWPGFQPLTSKGPNLLPDLGRVRWIH